MRRPEVAAPILLQEAAAEFAAEFAAAGPQLAKFGEQGIQAFKDLGRISKITGMEMEKVLAGVFE